MKNMLCRVTAGKPDSVDAAAFNYPQIGDML